MPKRSGFLYESHRGSPTLTLLNALGVLGVLNALNVLNMRNVSNAPMDASLAYWALFYFFLKVDIWESLGYRELKSGSQNHEKVVTF